MQVVVETIFARILFSQHQISRMLTLIRRLAIAQEPAPIFAQESKIRAGNLQCWKSLHRFLTHIYLVVIDGLNDNEIEIRVNERMGRNSSERRADGINPRRKLLLDDPVRQGDVQPVSQVPQSEREEKDALPRLFTRTEKPAGLILMIGI